MIDFVLVVLLRVALLTGILFGLGLMVHRSRPSLRSVLALASLGAAMLVPVATPLLRHAETARTPLIQSDEPAEFQAEASAVLSVPPQASSDVPAAPKPSPVKPILFGLWAVGLTFFLSRLLHGLIAARRLAMCGRDAVVCGRRCRVSELAVSPMCLAWPAGQIVLPESSLSLSPDQLEACLAHETHHAERGDALKLVLARFARAVFWPVGFVWLLERQLRLALEESADDAAVGIRPEVASGYAELLRDLAVRRSPAEAAALTMVTPLMLKTRIHRILSSTADRRPVSRASRALLSSSILGLGAAAAFGVLKVQESDFKYDDSKIKNPVIARTKSGKVIEIFEVQEDRLEGNVFRRVAWRPNGEQINDRADFFPLSSGLKSLEGSVIVWARVRAEGLTDPTGEIDRLVEGTNWMGWGGNSRTANGWHYFCGVIAKPEGFLQSRVEGHLIWEPWHSSTLLNTQKPLPEKGTASKTASFVESLTWQKGEVHWPDNEAMKKAYGDMLGKAQVMLITKVVQGTYVRIVMKESWQPADMRIEFFDRSGKLMDHDFSAGMAELEGRQRGYELELDQTPDKIGKIVLSERGSEKFNAPRIYLSPINGQR